MPNGPTYRDALPTGPVRGRAAGVSPGNRFESVRLHVLGDHLDQINQQASDARGRQVATQVLVDHARSLINPVSSPDIGFRWSINPYRGCEHGCIYCYARPDHERLGFNCGLDFETKIFAKLNAPALLRKELSRPGWRGECIAMSGVTDCYQPIEAKLKLTRGCLEVMAECRQPVSIVTKNRLVLRDLDLIRSLHEHQAVHVAVSVTTLNAHLAAKMEPRASSPRDRLETIRQLADAGVPVTVMVAPVVPGLTDREIPGILQAAAQAGAQQAGYVLLRLPYQVKDLFLDWLSREFPQRASHVESLLRQTRQGRLYHAGFGQRHKGQGPLAEQIQHLFKVFAARHGLNRRSSALCSEGFRRPGQAGQMRLFDDD